MHRYFISFLAGAALVCAFEPVNLPWLSFFCVALLFYLWCDTNPKQSLYIGCLFGFGLFLTGVSWVYTSLHTYGGMPFWMASLSVLAFSGVLSLYIGLQGYCLAVLFPTTDSLSSPLYRLLAMPLLWVLFEWLKGWLFTGFPWLDIGYTQTNSWFYGFAAIGGVYLVSFSVVVMAVLLVFSIRYRHKSWLAVILGVSILVGAWQLSLLNWSENNGKALNITVVQGNVPVDKKWQPDQRRQVINSYTQLTKQAHQQQAQLGNSTDLTIWPETALPLFVQQTHQQFWDSLMPNQSALLVGLLDSQGDGREYNAALLHCNGKQQVYRKRHLVPFGEYLPLRFLFDWVLDYLQLPMSDFSAWQGQQPLVCEDNINIGLSICYEDAFANELRQHIGEASILVNISEDAWFGDSLAPHQRLQMAQMRAQELARPLIRSANTGPSVFINEKGRILAQTKQFEVQTLSQSVQPVKGQTPFARFGNWFVGVAFLLLVLVKAGYKRCAFCAR